MKIYIFNIAVVLLALASFSSCSDDDDKGGSGGGTPVVRYVRPCDVTISDSLLTGGYLGSQIAIIGENLSGVNAIYFNDQKAKLNPNYVTNNAIIVTIPSGIPAEKEDLIRLYTKNDSCYYTFETLVPAPTAQTMTCEYVEDGDIAYIQGLYFINEDAVPLSVVFEGGAEGEIISYDINNIAVKVPIGAQSGPIKITSVYGTGQSDFEFRDNRNMIMDFEDTSWNTWGLSAFASEGGPSGQYMTLEGTVGSWSWPANQLQVFYNHPTRNPIVSTGEIEDLALCFEVYSHEWHEVPLLMWFSNLADTHDVDGSAAQAHWKPYLVNGVKTNYVTDGWITVSIPLTDFKYSKDESEDNRIIANLDELVDFHAMFFGAADGTTNVKLWIDNVRIKKYK